MGRVTALPASLRDEPALAASPSDLLPAPNLTAQGTRYGTLK
jgi:hypothetical protein